MNGNDGTRVQVTLRVHRFTPRPERDRPRSGSPFAKQGSPFGSGTARRRPRGKQWIQDYPLSVLPDTTILDCLLDIKRTQDPSLAFRYSCGHGMCGSDAVAINGTPTLLCTAKVKDWAVAQTAQNTTDAEGFRKTAGTDADPADNAADVSGTSGVSGAHDGSPLVIELSALPGFPVQRDLIADIDPMLEQIKRLKPYLQADGKLATTKDGKIDVFEYLQRPEQLATYETLSNCIACGVCEGSCPVFAGGEAFIGPAALITASRFINDSRDTAADARMDAIDAADGIAACQSVRACSRHCPRGIDVGEEIWQLIAKVKER
ncbi:succinate dehydrogenase iron-sulfur protein SdhB [Bifidobacterium porcinum]|nr:succinate dehydrogenase iron-sulfur protein SdhB [Bifidobacterium porcinum]